MLATHTPDPPVAVGTTFNDRDEPLYACSTLDVIEAAAFGTNPAVVPNVSVPDAMFGVRRFPAALTITPFVLEPGAGVPEALIHGVLLSKTFLLVLDAEYTRPDADCLLTHHVFGFVEVSTKT